MNIQDVGWTDVSSFEEKMRVAALMPAPDVEPPSDYIAQRDAHRASMNYSVTVAESLLIVRRACGRYDKAAENSLVIPLPFIRGVGPIYKCYTKGRGSSVDLLAFNITMAGKGETFVIQQSEPFVWYGRNTSDDWKIRSDGTESEMSWHRHQLAIQRHEILSATNMYINRVLQMSPENRQLILEL